MDSFLDLLYLRGAMDQHNFPCDLLWSSEYGCKAFPATMSRDRFRDIKKYIRFDVLSTRRERLQNDKFALISYVFNRFVENSQKCYVPRWSVSVDEQLFPTKSRCKFTQYMSSKPDKFGIKFWILAEVESKYCYNVLPYLGKDESRVGSLGTSVVIELMKPLYGKGYNVTCDNFFTNADLSEKLIEKRCSIVGTVRQCRGEIPDTKNLQLHESKFYQNGKMNLTAYQAKRSKTVYLLSTLHTGTSCETEGKRKPHSVVFYNNNRYGVDMLDSMCRQMTTKAGCRRWPLAVFFNILDLAGVNAHILYQQKTGSNISRRKFLFELSAQLRASTRDVRSENIPSEILKPRKLLKRKNCNVMVMCKRNRASMSCLKCKQPTCGQCLTKICVKCAKFYEEMLLRAMVCRVGGASAQTALCSP